MHRCFPTARGRIKILQQINRKKTLKRESVNVLVWVFVKRIEPKNIEKKNTKARAYREEGEIRVQKGQNLCRKDKRRIKNRKMKERKAGGAGGKENKKGRRSVD